MIIATRPLSQRTVKRELPLSRRLAVRTDAGQCSTGKPALASGHDAVAGVPRWQLWSAHWSPERRTSQEQVSLVIIMQDCVRSRKRHEFPHRS